MFAPKTNTAQSKPKTSLFGNGSHGFVQPKLNMGKPGDKYEVEADKAADQIVAKGKENSSSFLAPAPNVQKQSDEEVQKYVDNMDWSKQTNLHKMYMSKEEWVDTLKRGVIKIEHFNSDLSNIETVH